MSLRNAINAKCRECIYEPGAAGNWRQQIEACTSPKCPLFSVRPQSSGMARAEGLIAQEGADLGQYAAGIEA